MLNFCHIDLCINKLLGKRAFSLRETYFGLCLKCESLVEYQSLSYFSAGSASFNLEVLECRMVIQEIDGKRSL